MNFDKLNYVISTLFLYCFLKNKIFNAISIFTLAIFLHLATLEN